MASTGAAAARATSTPKKVPQAQPTIPKINLAAIGKATENTKPVESFSKHAKTLVDDARLVSTRTIKDPTVQASVVSAAAGTVIVGACGGAIGMLAGGAVGLPFVLFTFGLSVPISAAIGGGLGVAAGSATGCATGAATGYTAYTRRQEIRDFITRSWSTLKSRTHAAEMYLERTLNDFVHATKTRYEASTDSIASKAKSLSASARGRAAPVAQKVQNIAKDPHAQVTAVSAVAGGVAAGVPCGAIGMIGGAVVGLVPAVFTFGLSIPVCAVVGGSAGVCVGGAAGAASVGVAGYGLYAKKTEIREGAMSVGATVKKMCGRA